MSTHRQPQPNTFGNVPWPGGVPDAQFGVSKDAGFSYFAKMGYDHSEKYPKGTMGSFSGDRLPEVLLREII